MSIFRGSSRITSLFKGDLEVLKVLRGSEIVYEKSSPVITYTGLHFTALANTTIGVSNVNNNAPDLSYSLDDGTTWTSWSGNNYASVSLLRGDTICIKGNNPNGFSSPTWNESVSGDWSRFTSTGNINAGGDIMSLIDNGACTTTVIPNNYCFYRLLYNIPIVNAGGIVFSATTLTEGCYHDMFCECRSLTTPPSLNMPTVDMTTRCMSGMFFGCSSMVNPPTLSVHSLAEMCFSGMFWNCSSLTTVPSLPYTNLVQGCYYRMFQDCRSLTTATELPATVLPNDTLVVQTIPIGVYKFMFSGCSSLTRAPKLPALQLTYYCYANMFENCSSLNYIEVEFMNWSSSSHSTDGWVSGVSASGEFKCPSTVTQTIGASNIPTGWTITHQSLGIYANENTTIGVVKNGSINTDLSYSLDDGATWTSWSGNNYASVSLNAGEKMRVKGNNPNGFNRTLYNYITFSSSNSIDLYGDIMSLIDNGACTTTVIPSNYCFMHLFKNAPVKESKNLILSATTLTDYCYSEMFEGCSSLTTAPELPAENLTDNCYSYMFMNCSSLNTAPELPSKTLNTQCYAKMFSGCSSLTTAPELPATTLYYQCYYEMFMNCSSLNYIKVYFTEWNLNYTRDWVNGVSSTGDFICKPSLPSTRGTHYIPTGWTISYIPYKMDFEDLSDGDSLRSYTTDLGTLVDTNTNDAVYNTNNTNWWNLGKSGASYSQGTISLFEQPTTQNMTLKFNYRLRNGGNYTLRLYQDSTSTQIGSNITVNSSISSSTTISIPSGTSNVIFRTQKFSGAYGILIDNLELSYS